MGSIAMLKKKIEDQHKKPVASSAPQKTIGNIRKRTPILLKSSEGATGLLEKEALKSPLQENKEHTDSNNLPMGYSCIGRNDLDKLMLLKEEIIKAKICALDYETDADPDDDTIDTQDHHLTMLSVGYQIGQAFCFPLAMDAYGANWDLEWFIENFLKPILLHPDVLIIIHNVK